MMWWTLLKWRLTGSTTSPARHHLFTTSSIDQDGEDFGDGSNQLSGISRKWEQGAASTSEVYGDPEVHPQPESYRGNVNPMAYVRAMMNLSVVLKPCF